MRNIIGRVALGLLLPSLAFSLPQAKVEPEYITPALFESFKRYASYSLAAYCTDNDQPVKKNESRQVMCGSKPCGSISPDLTNIVYGFMPNNISTNATGFVAVDDSARSIVISFRGTPNPGPELLLGELDAFRRVVFLDYFPFCFGSCQVADEVNLQWSDLRQTVFSEIRMLLSDMKYQTYNVVFTGHSLGAAVATLAAADYRENFNGSIKPRSSLYSFASPRLFTQRFAEYANRLEGDNYRVTHFKDRVIRIPEFTYGSAMMEHMGDEYFIGAEYLSTELPINIVKYPTTVPPFAQNSFNTLEDTRGALRYRGLSFAAPPVPTLDNLLMWHQDYLFKLTAGGCN